VLPVTHANSVYTGDHAGLIAGIGAGSWSAVVAIMMPYFGRLFDLRDYSQAFWIAAAFPIAGAGLWLVLTPRTNPDTLSPD
jgi:MFS transporter, ACS family, hexuronate transporter